MAYRSPLWLFTIFMQYVLAVGTKPTNSFCIDHCYQIVDPNFPAISISIFKSGDFCCWYKFSFCGFFKIFVPKKSEFSKDLWKDRAVYIIFVQESCELWAAATTACTFLHVHARRTPRDATGRRSLTQPLRSPLYGPATSVLFTLYLFYCWGDIYRSFTAEI